MSQAELAGSRRLVAVIACRNSGTRLYGKPLQNLDVATGVTILDNIVDCLRTIKSIDDIVFAIAEGPANLVFQGIAQEKGIGFVIGDEFDVLSRLINGARVSMATDVFRVTSESPFLYFEEVERIWQHHVESGNDATFMDDVIDGCGFEIVRLTALEFAHNRGEDRHRSELCTLYLRENDSRFRLARLQPPAELIRRDLRLTVDNPEDLIVCRAVYSNFKSSAPRIPVLDVVDFLDAHPGLVRLCAPFTEDGYKTMYT